MCWRFSTERDIGQKVVVLRNAICWEVSPLYVSGDFVLFSTVKAYCGNIPSLPGHAYNLVCILANVEMPRLVWQVARPAGLIDSTDPLFAKFQVMRRHQQSSLSIVCLFSVNKYKAGQDILATCGWI